MSSTRSKDLLVSANVFTIVCLDFNCCFASRNSCKLLIYDLLIKKIPQTWCILLIRAFCIIIVCTSRSSSCGFCFNYISGLLNDPLFFLPCSLLKAIFFIPGSIRVERARRWARSIAVYLRRIWALSCALSDV